MAGSAVIGALRVNLGIDTAAFSDGLKNANARLSKFGATLKTGLIGAAAAGAAAIGGMAVAVKGTVDAADEMAKASKAIGLPIEELSRLRYAADLSGVSFQSLQNGVKRLSMNMSDALAGTGEGAKAFEQLGISVTGADGKLKSSSALMQEVADKFAAMPDGAEKTALAMRLFGKAGADMIPMLNGGSEALGNLMSEADQFGQVFTAEMGANAELFNDNITRLKGTFAGMAAELTERLLPYLAQFTNWLVENAPAITANIAGFIDFAAAIVRAGADITSFVSEKIGAFVAAIRALPEQMVQIGADIINGLWSGIQSAWSGVKDKVTGLASGIKDSFTGFFQIRSPSRVMMAVGQDIIAGLNIGMQTGADATPGVVSSIAGQVTGAFSGLADQAKALGDSLSSSIGNGLSSVIDGSKSAADAFRDMAKDMLSQLAKLAAQKLFSSIFGGFGGGLGGLWSGLTGFATGGSFMVGGAGGIDSQLVAFKASPNERVTVTKPGQMSGMGGGINMPITINAPGADAAALKRVENSVRELGRSMPAMVDSRLATRQTRGTRA